MRTAWAIRHVPFEDLGSFEQVLADNGYRVAYCDIIVDDPGAIDPIDPDLVVVLGGPIGVYEAETYPVLTSELRLLEQRLGADRPTLGICLGAQLMARALGARVYPGSRKEIGWSALALTDEGRQSPLRHLAADKTQVLHWHGDTFDLPEGATRLASTELYNNQAFSWGRNALALQFHPEVTPQALERWFIGHACEIGAAPGLSVPQLRAQAAHWSPMLEPQGRRCLEEWLARR